MEGMELCECEQGLNGLECKGKSKIEIKVEASLTYNEDNTPSTA